MFVQVVGVLGIILGIVGGIIGIICLIASAMESDHTTKKLNILMD